MTTGARVMSNMVAGATIESAARDAMILRMPTGERYELCPVMELMHSEMTARAVFRIRELPQEE